MATNKTAVSEFLEARGKEPISTIKAVLGILKNTYRDFAALSPVPFPFSRGHKEFIGFYAFGEKHVLRFEAKSSSSALEHVSVWDLGTSLSAAPKYTVDVRVGGDITAASAIAEAISKGIVTEGIQQESFSSKALQEATADDIKQFVNEVGDEGGTLSGMYRKYAKWAEDKGMRVVSDITFSDYLKRMRSAKSAPAQSTSVAVAPGVADDSMQAPEFDEFEQEILNNSVLYKYEMMAEIVKRIVVWDPLYTNAFIYGSGGIGKTFTVKQVVKQFADPNSVKVYKGAISGFTGMLQILWENREKKIIILDDNDTVLEVNTALNLLKGAMDSDEPRIVSYTRFKKGSIAKKEEGIDIDVSHLAEGFIKVYENGELALEEKLTKAQVRWYEKASGVKAEAKYPMIEALDIADAVDEYDEGDSEFAMLDPDVDPAFGMGPDEGAPDAFQFTSRVIFISNLTQVPQPLMDRCITIGLNLTKEQILALIEDKLEAILPELPLELKKEVLAFMRKYVHRIGKSITFRLFQQICAIFSTNHPESRKMAYITMQGEGMKTKMR